MLKSNRIEGRTTAATSMTGIVLTIAININVQLLRYVEEQQSSKMA